MKITELLEFEILNAPMNEMANLYPQETGVSAVMWFGEVGGQHGPRLKVSNTPGKFDVQNNFVVAVSKNPMVLTPRSAALSSAKIEDVKDWIKLNYDTLMELWKIHETGNGSSLEFLAKLKKI